MEIEHCMHELVPFLDILCSMSRRNVKATCFESEPPLKSYILNLLTHLNKSIPFAQPNDLDQLTICKNLLDVLCLMNVRVG